MNSSQIERQLQMKTYLIGKTLYHRKFQPAHSADRSFCSFCRNLFGSGSFELQIGYYEQESDSWICERCAANYQEPFEWTMVTSKVLQRESAVLSEEHSGIALF